MLYLTYRSLPKEFTALLEKNQRDYTLAEVEEHLAAYRATQTSSFFTMPQLQLKQLEDGTSTTVLELELKSSEMSRDDFSLKEHLENYLLSNHTELADFENLQEDLERSFSKELELPSHKTEGKWKKILPALKRKTSQKDSEIQKAVERKQEDASEYDFTQDFTEEELELAESELEDLVVGDEREQENPVKREESRTSPEKKKNSLQENEKTHPDYSEKKQEVTKLDELLFHSLRETAEGLKEILADPRRTAYEKRMASFQLEREQEKLRFLESNQVSHQRALENFRSEKEEFLREQLENRLDAVRMEKEEAYETILMEIESRAKSQYEAETKSFQTKLEEERQQEQAVLKRNYEHALSQLEARLKEKERLKKAELAERGNHFLEEEYTKRRQKLEREIEEERQVLSLDLAHKLDDSLNQLREELLAKRTEELETFQQETQNLLADQKEGWYQEFAQMEREIQQTEKAKQQRLQAETYQLRAKAQLEEALREKELQVASLQAEVEKTRNEYQLFIEQQKVALARKEEESETYKKEREEMNRSFKDFLDLNQQKQKAGMALSLSSFLVLLVVLILSLQ